MIPENAFFIDSLLVSRYRLLHFAVLLLTKSKVNVNRYDPLIICVRFITHPWRLMSLGFIVDYQSFSVEVGLRFPQIPKIPNQSYLRRLRHPQMDPLLTILLLLHGS